MPRAEVHHLDLAGRGEPDVGRLEVEVEDALAVGVGQALAELAPDVEDPLDRQRRVAAQDLGEAHPGHELRRHPGLALVLPDAQHRRDVRVPEGARRLGVAPQAGDGGGRVLRARS